MATSTAIKNSLTAQKMKTNMKNMWESAKRDFTQNSPQVKQEFRDMLDYARSKTQLLKRPSVPGPTEINTQLERAVNMDVGGELLTHYKEHWSAIHAATQLSGIEATKLDSELAELCNRMSQSHAIIQRCHAEFSRLPEIISTVEETQKKVNSLGEMLEQMEASLTEYSRVKAQLESQRKQNAIRAQYDKHSLEGEGKIEQLKNILAQERSETVDRKNTLAAQKLQERQKTFQGIFNEQMAEYREKGSVERPIMDEDSKERAGSTLDEVVIDDKDGSASLDTFLSDVVLEETEKKPHSEEDS